MLVVLWLLDLVPSRLDQHEQSAWLHEIGSGSAAAAWSDIRVAIVYMYVRLRNVIENKAPEHLAPKIVICVSFLKHVESRSAAIVYPFCSCPKNVDPSGLLLTLLGERGGRLATAQNREAQFLRQIRVQFPKSLVWPKSLWRCLWSRSLLANCVSQSVSGLATFGRSTAVRSASPCPAWASSGASCVPWRYAFEKVEQKTLRIRDSWWELTGIDH